MEGKYITVLDHSDGKVYQYENLEHFIDGWNGKLCIPIDKNDDNNIEWYLTKVKGHRLNDINWMLHDENRIWTDYSETITD